ncbi:PTS sugar transporter subunit IIA [Corynebacterium pseudopelargi]|uniref:Ascorbate-specific PTS system EIIA component n=1 Tax=Corynebacterium pseudopelargi TaxID=2080757 RepID=A0A3G6IXW9_9CORY|nr:PTS sugar transporter subunit IIA [Corynebacterium pseudopelargi]AZA08824.1 Ascorbate-specific phosphotransferase enzyme IIA component [Corynebacterium pseudopelargi]
MAKSPSERTRFVPDVVAAQCEAADWEEAIRLVGRLYQEQGIASSEYAEAMIKGVKEFGPYMVLTPGVAMPHAKTVAGVQRPGTAVVTLKTPVEFGSPANDPVDVLISFAAGDNHGHIEMIQSLAGVLSDRALLDRARAAEDDEALMNVFLAHHS